MKILITGHRGFVGRHFMQVLNGHEIIGIDLKDGNDCRDYFKYRNGHFDLVIHLAAIVGGRATIEGNPLSVAIDLSIDAEFFNWVSRTKPTNVVYFSSSAAYPTELQTGKSVPLKESDIDLQNIKSPDLTYGWAKLTGEYLASFISDSNVYVFRPFSGYGADQDDSYPFPSFIDRALRKDNPFEIWGTGGQCRDFVHIDDIVQAVLFHVENRIIGTFNICSGQATSFNELAQLICNEAGYAPEFKHLKTAPVGVFKRVGDITKSHAYYVPQISLINGIREALKARKVE